MTPTQIMIMDIRIQVWNKVKQTTGNAMSEKDERALTDCLEGILEN